MSKKLLRTLLLITSLLFIVFALAACGGDDAAEEPAPTAVSEPTEKPAEPTDVPVVEEPTEEPTEEPAAVVELSGDVIYGGLMYDKWWKALRLDAPVEDHPLWATQDSNSRSGDTTWRCKECHGWDYKGPDGAYNDTSSHYTGFMGIFHLAGADPVEILAALQGETNPDHDFSTVMDEQALIDMALFISNDMLNSADAIADDKASVSSDVALGETLYTDTCNECHGPEGLAINFGKFASSIETAGSLSNGNPQEFMHKLRFGQPDTTMPSAVESGWTMEEQTAVLAYVQTFPSSNPAVLGGQLYDKWWKAYDVDAPEEDQVLWATQDSNTREGSDTWRCKECHGWDYQGPDGAYNSDSSHHTGFTGLLAASNMSVDELIAWLNGETSPDHDFSAYLDEAAIEMLAMFVQEGVVDMTPFINADKTVNGDVENGSNLYTRGCSSCHGTDGQKLNFGSDDDPVYLGDLSVDNPWETLHKAANGQPAEHMPSGINLGWSWQELADVIAYLQTLAE